MHYLYLFLVLIMINSCSGADPSEIESPDGELGETATCPGTIEDANPKGNFDVLIWADEFNQDGSPCTVNWVYEVGNNYGWGNGESQYYKRNDEDNVIVENGALKITAIKEAYNGYSYTSTRMTTQTKFNFKYGKIDVRAKLPKGAGTWPAIWMLGSNFSQVGWPNCGEIDIMEHKGSQLGTVHSSLHNGTSYGNTIHTKKITIENADSEFHNYTALWSNEKIEFSIDGSLFYSYQPEVKNSASWPYDNDFFLILNIAMGGGFGGSIDPNFTKSSMEIDYIRIYQ